MSVQLKRGDRVQWSFRGHKVVGKVQKKLTARTEVGGRPVAASPEDPRYLLKTEKSGREVAHKASALTLVR